MQAARDLLELQQVDIDIRKARKALEAIPETKQIQEVRANLKELARRTTKITGMLKDQQIEAEDNDGRRATLTRHVEEVKLDTEGAGDDFRRVQANNAQLDNLAKRLEKVDFNQQKVLAEIERLEGLVAQAADLKERLEAREAELTEAFVAKASSRKEELQELMARREGLCERIPADLLERYQASCDAHGQLGVVALEDSTCAGCRVEMQRSQIDALRRGPDVATCPICGRMLVVRS